MTPQPSLDISDIDLVALNIFMEARGECLDGQAAVARVTINRTKLKYESHGTIESTVLWPNAFSWTQWTMINRVYQKIAFSPSQQISHVQDCYKLALKNMGWTTIKNIAEQVMNGTYHSPSYDHLTDNTVLYYNPAATRGIPNWANTDKLVTVIGHHWFFNA